MSTIVCQNLVHFLGSQQAETTTLKLIIAAAPPSPPSGATTILESGSWGSLLTAPNHQSIEKDKNFCTNPFARKSLFSTLSSKSLELCTENLGSETGTDIVAGRGAAAVFSPPPLLKPSNSGGNPSPREKRVGLQKPNHNSHEENDSRRKIKNFPPPLTTISGGGGASSLQVRRRTDGGRLIIEAVEAPVRSSCLTAERSDGRLKLRLLTDSDAAATSGEESEVEDECGSETAAAADEIDEPMNETESEKEEMNLEMDIERIQMLSRCHGNRGLCSDFKPSLWVATS